MNIGFLFDDYTVQKWMIEPIRLLSNNPMFNFVLIIDKKPINSIESKIQSIDYHSIIENQRKINVDSAMDSIDLNSNKDELISSLNNLQFLPNIENCNVLSNFNLDIIVNFSKKIRLCIDSFTKNGIFQLFFGEDFSERFSPIGIWEINTHKKTSVINIEKIPSKNELGYTICKSIVSTNEISIKRNQNNLLWSASELLFNFINNFSKFEYISKENSIDLNSFEKLTLKKIATKNKLNFHTTSTINTFKSKLKKKSSENWDLLYALNFSDLYDFKKYKKIDSPDDRFWADPFFIFQDNYYYIFIEEKFFEKPHGHISVIQIDSNGNFIQTKKIIEQPYHLSFPFIFKFEDTFFMIPESHQKKTIDVFKCVNFPYEWEFYSSIMTDVDAVDTIIYPYEKKWWLFTSIKNSTFSQRNGLQIFYSDNPLTNSWIPHPKNPVINDVRYFRSAGNIFEKDGELFRPSQFMEDEYGYGISINKIDLLNFQEYVESPKFILEPNWTSKISGLHTINHDDNFSIIDIKSYGKIKS